MDGPVLELADPAPSQRADTAVEDLTAAEPVKGAPVAQLQVGAALPKAEASEGRTQVEYAAWRQLQLNAAQVPFCPIHTANEGSLHLDMSRMCTDGILLSTAVTSVIKLHEYCACHNVRWPGGDVCSSLLRRLWRLHASVPTIPAR